MYTQYGVCELCGKIVSKRETTQTGEDTQDGETYIKVKGSEHGCAKKKQHVDILGRV